MSKVDGSPLVSVVLSFRNEEQTLPELIRRLDDALRPLALRYELIFVNDDSRDGSLEVLKDRATADPRIKVVNMSRRFGYYECVLAGLAYSVGDAVITMDADLQDPPEVLPLLVEKWREGADVVYTVRRSRSGEPALKVWLTHLAYRAIQRTSEIEIPVDAGDYKLLTRRVVDHVLEMDEAAPYLRGLISWVGFRQVPVYYDRQPRFAGSSQRSILLSAEPAKVFLSGITFASHAPVTAFLLLGFLVALAGVMVMAGLAALALAGAHVDGWVWLVGFLLLLSGVQFLGLGALGLYVGRTLDGVRRRPRYIVASTIGLPERP